MKRFACALFIGSTAVGFVTVGLSACGSDAESTPSSTGGGGASSSSSSGAGGTTSQGGFGGTGTGGGTAGAGTGGIGGGTGDCTPACGGGLVCCDGVCTNPGNDIKNCGGCGVVCSGPSPFCDGKCTKAPCDAGNTCGGGQSCCGSNCCNTGEICCVVPMGPVGPPTCQKPNDNGTCEPGCPDCVCASPDTPIATPTGDRRIADLAVGDLVLSVDGGSIRVVPVERINRVVVEHHRVVRVTLATGRIIEMSARHPTVDGRTFGALRPGDVLAGTPVASVETVPYAHEATYDILPGSDSGAYFASGALVASTLAPEGAAPRTVPSASFAAP